MYVIKCDSIISKIYFYYECIVKGVQFVYPDMKMTFCE